MDAFVMLACTQPTLVQCFAARGKRPLLTPRGVDQRGNQRGEQMGLMEKMESLVPMLIPTCGLREKGPRREKLFLNPTANRGPLHDDKRLRNIAVTAAAAAGGTGTGTGTAPPSVATSLAAPGGPPDLLSVGSRVVEGFQQVVGGLLAGTSDAFGGMGGVLDGALSAMEVPLKRNPLGLDIRSVDELSLALGEAELEPPHMRIVLGFDCAAHNRSAGRNVFSGKPLHASGTTGLLDADPNPYQLAIFMLGKAFEVLGMGSEDIYVRCFCYNTMPPGGDTIERPGPPNHERRTGDEHESERESERERDGRSPSALEYGSRRSTLRRPFGEVAAGLAGSSGVVDETSGQQWAEPVVTDGLDGALAYYNALPPYVFRGARGAAASQGLAHAIQYGKALAQRDASAGATRTLLLLLTPGQGIDSNAAKEALAQAGKVPLSIVAIGVGDGPFHELGRLAASAPHILNAVDFHLATSSKFPDRALALETLRTLPAQAERWGDGKPKPA